MALLAFLLGSAPVTTKVQRQQTIARLIAKHPVTSQPQLVDLLAGEGIVATQATVSRDLEDLGAVKVRVPGGETVYAIPEFEPARLAPEDHLRRVMGEWVAEVRSSGNLVVLRTPPGCAHVVALGARPVQPARASSAPWPATTRCCASPRTTLGGAGARGRRCATWPGCRERRARDASPPASTAAHTLWHGRFEGGPAAELMAYTESLSFDQRLWPDDIAGSRAHVRGLARAA